jgi:hypothetical protein
VLPLLIPYYTVELFLLNLFIFLVRVLFITDLDMLFLLFLLGSGRRSRGLETFEGKVLHYVGLYVMLLTLLGGRCGIAMLMEVV